jgi:hypothetical protein
VESEFGREIRDRFLQGRTGASFSVGILAGEIFLESVVNLFEFAEKSFVGGEFFQPGLTGELEHADGVVIGPVPKLGVEMTEKATGGRLPRPPDIEADFAERLEGGGKGRYYIIGVEVWHGGKRANIAILSRNGKAANCGRGDGKMSSLSKVEGLKG